jgi:xanthine dehydrogenase accessory factor
VVSAEGSAPAKPGARMIVRADATIAGTVGGAGLERQVIERALESIRSGKGGLHTFKLWYKSEGGLDSLCGGTVEVHIEYVKPRPHILIAGGGHVGKALADMASALEYAWSVYDVRPEFASAERFPAAHARYDGEAAGFLARFDPAACSHVVVCGHSYHVDLDLLAGLLPRFHGWVGVIASRAKKIEMFRALAERGIGAERLARVECPIGLAIGAVTPPELAVSILASIIRDTSAAPGGTPAA